MDPGSSLTPVVFRNAASVLWIAALKRLRSLVVYALTARAPLHRPFTPQLVFLSTDPPDPVTAQCSSWAPPHLQNRDQAPSRAVCPKLSAICSPLPLLSSPPLLDSPHLPSHMRLPQVSDGVHTPSSVPFCVPIPLPKMSSFPPPPPLQKSIPPCFVAFYLLTFPDLGVRMNSSFLIPWLFTYRNPCHSQSLIRVPSF